MAELALTDSVLVEKVAKQHPIMLTIKISMVIVYRSRMTVCHQLME